MIDVCAAAACAGLAVWLLTSPSPRWRLRKLGSDDSRLAAWLAPTPGALPARLRAGVAVGGFLAVGAVAGSWLVAATAGPVVAAVVYVGLGKLPGSSVQAENERIVAALPQACDLIAAALQAGLPLRNATEAVADSTPGPLGKALSQLCARVRLGASESEAWLDLSESPGLGQVGRELGRSLERGMAVSGLLAQLAEAARKEATNQAVVKARRVGVRSVMPLMVCFLPAFILLGIVPIIGGVIGGVIGNILP